MAVIDQYTSFTVGAREEKERVREGGVQWLRQGWREGGRERRRKRGREEEKQKREGEDEIEIFSVIHSKVKIWWKGRNETEE